MSRPFIALALLVLLTGARDAAAQLVAAETTDATVIYVAPAQTFIAAYAQRTVENSLAFHRKLFDYTPSERMTVLLTDFSDSGNASAETVPHNFVTARLAPLSFAYETFTANERMNYLMNHEFVHVVTSDRASKGDRRFRTLFSGKVVPTAEHPESLLYFYLTSPRRASPRWYQEGIAVFLDTWMAGGLGRAQGPSDEMVFRSMTLDGSRFFDPLGLSSELTKTDFRLESNSYLYGGRFMNYLAYRSSPESLIKWVSRTDGSKAYYASQFARVFGKPLEQAWQDWIAFEQDFQRKNIAEIRTYPVTPFTDVSPRALGSLSRAFVDQDAQVLYAGLNYPGTLGYVGAISLRDGSVHPIRNIRGPRIYSVTSMAFDPKGRTLFYTADNAGLRDLMRLDPSTGRERMLFKDLRAGDLAFDRADASLWGIRTFNGICTLIRIAAPYTEWKQVYSWPYRRSGVRPGRVTRRHAARAGARRDQRPADPARDSGVGAAARRRHGHAALHARHRHPVELHLFSRRPAPLRQLVLHRRLEHLPLRPRNEGDAGAHQQRDRLLPADADAGWIAARLPLHR